VVTDSKARPRLQQAGLTPEQLREVLKLLKGADSVELKLSVPDADRRSAIAALDMDPLDAQMRQVVFFDTPDLTLNKVGVVVRGRRVQGREGDSVIKLRPVVPDDMPAALRKDPMFGIEVDAMPGGFVCSGSMKGRHEDALVKSVFRSEQPIRKLFTKAQRAFYAAHAPEGLELAALTRLGPINVLKLKFNPADFGRKMVAELWFYPDGSRLLELSTKCLPSEGFSVAAEAKAFLANHGIDLLAEQQTKTKTALEFYAREMADANADARR
jgi:hypothetical protein